MRLAMLALVLLAAAVHAQTTDTSETFDVNARYEGTVKKGFHDLGKGTLSFKNLGGGRFQVTMDAKVKEPNKNEILEAKIHREYKISAKSIHKISEHDWFNEAAAKHKKRFIDCVSLGFVVKWLTPADNKGIRPLRYTLEDETYEIDYVDKPDKGFLEATLRNGSGIVGDFALLPAGGGVRPVKKFHVKSKDHLGVGFVNTKYGGDR